MSARSAVAVAAVFAVGVAGCAQTPALRPAPPPQPYVRSTDAQFTTRAAYVAQAWEGLNDAWFHGFVPLQGPTVEGATGAGAYKASAYAGRYRLATMATLPVEAPADAVVAFEDGDSMRVAVVTAVRAYNELTATGDEPCVGCPVLTVTGATLGTVKIATSRGPATVPAWLFTVAQLSSPMAQLAVAAADQMDAAGSGRAGRLDRLAAAGSLDSWRLGGRVPGSVAAVRRRSAAAGVGDRDRGGPRCDVQPNGLACDDAGVGPNVPMSVTLSRPLADRLVIDVLSGQAVPERV